MKKLLFAALIAALVNVCFAQWKIAGDRIRTDFADKVDATCPLPEYPRPQMVRKDWKNLNGLWDYTVKKQKAPRKDAFDGKILVPFCVESALSGVGKRVYKDDEILYRTSFSIPENWSGKRVILNFVAVDWSCEVFVNGEKVGSHTGGYAPFSFDISGVLKNGKNELFVRVLDPSNDNGKSFIPRGKQATFPYKMTYTPVSGIWGTVWLEPVPENYISKVKIIPDFDAKAFNVKVSANSAMKVVATLLDGGKPLASAGGSTNADFRLNAPSDIREWTPDTPNLYDIKIDVLSPDGKIADSVMCYSAMRKISLYKDENSWVKMALNNRPIYQLGVLDQGYWPDGLYTAPTDGALKYDIELAKKLGFNMIRKHVKTEPARWYYHCDKLGILVWQDMPGGEAFAIERWEYKKFQKTDTHDRNFDSMYNFRKEWREIIDSLINFPSIVVWTPFNESWGQFRTNEIVDMTRFLDPSRLINSASGGSYFSCGDIFDTHFYNEPDIRLIDRTQANVIGEYGGVGLNIEGHNWEKKTERWQMYVEDVDSFTDIYLRAKSSTVCITLQSTGSPPTATARIRRKPKATNTTLCLSNSTRRRKSVSESLLGSQSTTTKRTRAM